MKNATDLDVSNSQYFYCQLKIDDIEIMPLNVMHISIREWIIDLVPRLHLALKDDGMLTELFQLKSNKNITVVLGKYENDENSIKASFSLHDYKIEPVGNNQLFMIEITALLDISNFYSPIYNRAFQSKTSLECFSQISGECGLTLKKSTNLSVFDKMTWYQINQTNFQFLKHVLNRSFRSNDVLFGYVDIKNNLNFKSIELEQNNRNIKADYDHINFAKNEFNDKEDENIIWYNYYNVINISGTNNKINNNGVKYGYYNLSSKQEDSVFDNSSKFADKSFTDSQSNVDYYNSIVQNNVHNNYARSIAQNKYLKTKLFGYALTLNINPIINVNLLDNVSVKVPSVGIHTTAQNINDRMSGRYFIGGIVYSAGKNKTYTKQLILFRDGYNEKNEQEYDL
ncbi:MAG: hypothetical protein ACOC2U_03475 [bacterium]